MKPNRFFKVDKVYAKDGKAVVDVRVHRLGIAIMAWDARKHFNLRWWHYPSFVWAILKITMNFKGQPE